MKEAQELLYLLYKYGKKYFRYGLCDFISTLKVNKIIDYDSFERLQEFIDYNYPPFPTEDNYWFECGDLEIRIEYLEILAKIKIQTTT